LSIAPSNSQRARTERLLNLDGFAQNNVGGRLKRRLSLRAKERRAPCPL